MTTRKPRRQRPRREFVFIYPRVPDLTPLPSWIDSQEIRQFMLDRLVNDPGTDPRSLFPCLRDEQESNRHGKDT